MIEVLNVENDIMKSKIVEVEHKSSCIELSNLVSLSDNISSCVNPVVNAHSNIASTSKQSSTVNDCACHHCGTIGHIQPNCPFLKQSKTKSKKNNLMKNNLHCDFQMEFVLKQLKHIISTLDKLSCAPS